MLVFQFRCDHRVKIEPDIVLVIGKPDGRDNRPR
jgi:hypothetical protein